MTIFNCYLPPRIHNLIDLVNLCTQHDKSFENFLSKAQVLNQFYIPTRYPTAMPGTTVLGMPDIKTAEKAIMYAKEIFSYCKNII